MSDLDVSSISSKPTTVPATGVALPQFEVKRIESILDQPIGVLAAGIVEKLSEMYFQPTQLRLKVVK